MTLEQLAIGVLAGAVFGLYGYFTKRDFDPDDGYEDFKWRKIGRTIVVYGAAGALVGAAGEPITAGRVEAATTTTVVLGVVFDSAIAAAQRERARHPAGGN